MAGSFCTHRIPGDGDAPVVSDLYDLADIVGRVGVAAAASFAAYLIGSLSTWASDLLPPAPLPEEHVDVEVHSWLGEPRMTPRTRISTAGHLALERVVFDAFNKISAADPNPKRIHEILSGERVGLAIFRSYQAKRLSRTTAAIVSAGVAAAASAIPFVGAAGTAVSGAGDLSRAWAEAEASLRDSSLANRLRILTRRVFHEFDEVRTADFPSDYPRTETPPSTAQRAMKPRFPFRDHPRRPPLLIAYLSVAWSPIFGLTRAVLALLYIDGSRREREANDLVADTLQLGRVEAPTLERLIRAAEAAADESKQTNATHQNQDVQPSTEHRTRVTIAFARSSPRSEPCRVLLQILAVRVLRGDTSTRLRSAYVVLHHHLEGSQRPIEGSQVR